MNEIQKLKDELYNLKERIGRLEAEREERDYGSWVGRLVMLKDSDDEQWAGPMVLEKYKHGDEYPFRVNQGIGYEQARLYQGPQPVNMTPWGGGNCPVHRDALVLVRRGGARNYRVYFANMIPWEHRNGGGDGDVVEYAVLDPYCAP